MKTQLFAASLLIAATSAQFANAAAAPDGTINFTGNISGATCQIAVNNGSAQTAGSSNTSVVTLPNITTSNMNVVGTTKGDTALNIKLSACTPGSGTAPAQARVYFQSGAGVASDGTLINTATSGAASGIALELFDSAGILIIPGTSTQGTSVAFPTTGSSTVTLPFTVKYVSTSTAPVAGAYSGSVTYSMSYN
ncbi:fimbrial protein [Pseudomonas marginalis]|uniref:fimbrial protein n=1 Tax=Pseudomonas marginalis TaxID=298 RepID=UPI003BA27234